MNPLVVRGRNWSQNWSINCWSTANILRTSDRLIHLETFNY